MLFKPSRVPRGQRPRGPITPNQDSQQYLGLHNWYPIVGDTTGGVFADYISKNDGIVQANPGIEVVPEHGLAANFSAGTTWVQSGKIALLASSTTPFTISTWVRCTLIGGTFPPNDSTVLEVSDNGSQAGATADKAIGIRSFGFGMQAFAYVYDGAVKTATGTTSVVDGTPHLITATYDGTTLTIYQNGISEGTVAASSSYSGYSSPQWVWSASNGVFGAGAQIYYGDLWDSRYYYNRCLSASEAYSLYEPSTRWDLYWQPSSRIIFDASSGGVSTNLNAAAGSYAITDPGGTALTKAVVANIVAGSYLVTGIDATTTTASGTQYSSALLSGSYGVTGVDFTDVFDYSLNAVAGSYSVTGVDTVTGKFAITTLNAVAGSYLATGLDLTTVAVHIMNAAPNSYVVFGKSINENVTVNTALTGLSSMSGSGFNFKVPPFR